MEEGFPNEMYLTKPSSNLNRMKIKHASDVAKKEVGSLLLAAEESKLQELTDDIQSESGRKNCFRLARQMTREGRDVISVCCKKDDAGNGVPHTYGTKEIWRKYNGETIKC